MEWKQSTKIVIVVLVSNLIVEQYAQFVPVDSCLVLNKIIQSFQCRSGVSHCLQDDTNQDGLVCVDWKWIYKGKCPYYHRSAMQLDEKDCQTSIGTCAENLYNSTQSPNYSGCYSKKEQIPSTAVTGVDRTTEESEKYRSTTIAGRGADRTVKENDNRYLLIPLILMSVLVVFFIIILIITCYKYFKVSHKGRSNRNGVFSCVFFRKCRKSNDEDYSCGGGAQTPLTQQTEDTKDKSKPMTQFQQSALNKCRVRMVKDIIPTNIKDYLIEYEIFPSLVLEGIMNKPSRLEQIRQLLDELPRRDYTAYSNFLQCLKRGGYGYIAEEIEQKMKELTNNGTTEPTGACGKSDDIDEHQYIPIHNGF